MSQKASGKAHRKGTSLVEIMRMFLDDATAEAWFAKSRWPDIQPTSWAYSPRQIGEMPARR